MSRDDEIVSEIRQRREKHAASFDYDAARITKELQKLDRESGEKLVRRASRKPIPIPTPPSA